MSPEVSSVEGWSTGFPPVEPDQARLLILGSLPGAESLRQQEYYAHPRNAFWPIMGDLFHAGRELAYEERLSKLSEQGVMLWDVLHAAHRPGSLDSAIDSTQLKTNDFPALFKRHPGLKRIAFNGTTSENLFCCHVLKPCGSWLEGVERVRLPSTSPAHASMTFPQKLDAWKAALTN